jgi:hypothetical protein
MIMAMRDHRGGLSTRYTLGVIPDGRHDAGRNKDEEHGNLRGRERRLRLRRCQGLQERQLLERLHKGA